MDQILTLAFDNLRAPMILFFALGFAAALVRSDLTVPEAVAKALSLYLMIAIGFKGGAALAKQGLGFDVLLALGLGVLLSFALPFLAFLALKLTTRLSAHDAAAVAAHYGSISVVTFVTATGFLQAMGASYSGYMVAVVAVMETPAIVSGLWLAHKFAKQSRPEGSRALTGGMSPEVTREILLNGSVVLLLGALAIGWVSGEKGYNAVAPFIDAPFKGVLMLFLLDMGLVAARRLRDATGLDWRTISFGIYMPLIGGLIGGMVSAALGFGQADVALFAVLSASASYIAVPAALRLALPEANPAIYLTLSLAVTFPFNIALGIPLYYALASWLTG